MEHLVARRRIRGAVAGLVATAVALGAAELAASARRDLRSPVFDVGARFIDATPVWLKDFAIEQFGTNDKLALLVGIFTLLALYGIAIGIAATRRRWAGVAGVVAFGAIGSYAAVGGTNGRLGGRAHPRGHGGRAQPPSGSSPASPHPLAEVAGSPVERAPSPPVAAAS